MSVQLKRILTQDKNIQLIQDNIQYAFNQLTSTQPASEPSDIWVNTPNGHGSTNSNIRVFTVLENSQGEEVTVNGLGDTVSGTSFTINEDGIYSISYVDANTGGDSTIGVSLNSNQLSTEIRAINQVSYLDSRDQLSSVYSAQISLCIPLNQGDVIRPHNGTALPNSTSYIAYMRVTKVGDV